MAPPPVSTDDWPAHILAGAAVAVTVGIALTVRLTPLSVPVTAGVELITLILYKVPATVLQGIIQGMVPALAVLASVPIFTGTAKLPAAFDNCAV